MWLGAATIALSVAILGHAMARRLAPELPTLTAFFAVGVPTGAVLAVASFLAWGGAAPTWATIAAYAFACELYLFLFTAVSGSISASLLFELRSGALSASRIEEIFGGKAMVERRLAKLVGAGLLDSGAQGYRHTARGGQLLWAYRFLRAFFWRAPLVPQIVTRPGPGPFESVLPKEKKEQLRLRLGHAVAIASVALVPLALLWPHLSGSAVFIGDSDRLNHFLSILKFLTDGYRQGLSPSWDELMFGGFPVIPFTNPYPTSLLHLLWPREQLFYAAGVVSCGLMIAAAWSAYAFLHDLKVGPLPAFVGSALYVLCAFGILKISQNDITYSAIVLIPLAMLVIRRLDHQRLWRGYLGLALLLAYLMLFAFLQKVAYAMLLLGGYAVYRGIVLRSWRIPTVLVAATITAMVASFPRIYAVGEDFLKSARYTKEAYRDFDKLYTAYGFGAHELLRWFDDRIFGRYYSEVGLLGNSLNLHEGLLLYMSAFAAFFLLCGLIRRESWWAPWAAGRRGDSTFFVLAVALCLFAVATKFGYFLLYSVFMKIEFIHARIVIAAMLPMCALVALLLALELAEVGRGMRTRLHLLALAWALVAAGFVVLGLEHAVRQFGTETLDIYVPAREARMHLMLAAIWRILVSLALVGLLLWMTRAKDVFEPLLRVTALYTLAFAMVGQAFVYSREQVAGEHMRGQWPPFRTPARLLADRGQFFIPSAQQRAELADRLEVGRFRSSLVCPPAVTQIFCPPHLTHFWGLRAVDGYLYAVPRRIAEVPWGEGALSLRALSFTDGSKLPWGLLGLFNVKYALDLTPELMSNFVRSAGSEGLKFSPAAAKVRSNPMPVAPRVFFARSVVAAGDLAGAREALFKSAPYDRAYDPAAESVAEGLPQSARYAADGSISAAFNSDRVSISFDPSPQPRFLVVNERFDERWKAFADGRDLAIFPTNVLMRGVVVPPGTRQVTMTYTPATQAPWAWGCYVAALLLLFGITHAMRRWESKRSQA